MYIYVCVYKLLTKERMEHQTRIKINHGKKGSNSGNRNKIKIKVPNTLFKKRPRTNLKIFNQSTMSSLKKLGRELVKLNTSMSFNVETKSPLS